MMNFFWKHAARFLSKPRIANALISYAMKHPYMHLPTNEDPSYMARYWVFNPYDRKTNKPRWFFWPWSVRIHHIKRADYERDMHDHPWNARTIILKGWYKEKRLATGEAREQILEQCLDDIEKVTVDTSRIEASFHYTRLPGDTAKLNFGEYHSIYEVDPDGAWTLFISGPWRGVWGFLVNGVKINWKQYLGIPEKGDLDQADPTKSMANGGYTGDGPAPVGLVGEDGPILNREQLRSKPLWPAGHTAMCMGCEVCDPENQFGWKDPGFTDLGKPRQPQITVQIRAGETYAKMAEEMERILRESGSERRLVTMGCPFPGLTGEPVPLEKGERVILCQTCGDTGRVRTSDYYGGSMHQPPECDTEPCDRCNYTDQVKDLPEWCKEITLTCPAHGIPGPDIKVEFDGAEYDGRMWLMSLGEKEEWIAIEGPENARKLLKHLQGWVDWVDAQAVCLHTWHEDTWQPNPGKIRLICHVCGKVNGE